VEKVGNLKIPGISENEYSENRPSSEEMVYLKRAASQERKGLYDRAIASIRKALEIAPGRASTYARLAMLCRAARKFDEAFVALKTGMECNPRDTELREMLLQICMESGKYEEAISESKRLLKQLPRNVYARDVLSMAYLQKGDYDKALRVTDELIFIDPLDPTNHFKKAVIYQQKGEIGAAMLEYARVLELDNQSEVAEDAQEAMISLDDLQLRQIITLAVEDALFRAKLARDPEFATAERGFVLSSNALSALGQLDFDGMAECDSAAPRYSVYS